MCWAVFLRVPLLCFAHVIICRFCLLSLNIHAKSAAGHGRHAAPPQTPGTVSEDTVVTVLLETTDEQRWRAESLSVLKLRLLKKRSDEFLKHWWQHISLQPKTNVRSKRQILLFLLIKLLIQLLFRVVGQQKSQKKSHFYTLGVQTQKQSLFWLWFLWSTAEVFIMTWVNTPDLECCPPSV